MHKRLLTLALAAMTSVAAVAQVTTAALMGVVRIGGDEATGASVKVTDTRSGAVYRAVANIDGRYSVS